MYPIGRFPAQILNGAWNTTLVKRLSACCQLLMLGMALATSSVFLTVAGENTNTAPSTRSQVTTNGFIPLTNNRDLTGWRNPYKWGAATAVGNEIHLSSDRKFFLVSEQTYRDFIFEGEVLLPAGDANSGFMFRAQSTPGRVFGYQAEVDGDLQRRWSGGLYDEGRRMWFISPIKGDSASEATFRQRAGDAFKRHDWNTYRITCQGTRIRIEVNGVTTTDIEDSTDSRGVIALQHHGEKGLIYRFRHLRIKELLP